MKKIVLTLLVVLACGWTSRCQAQDCAAIVRPFCILEGIDTNTYPAEKLEMYCQLSRCAFFITSHAPKGAIVHDISVLTNTLTNEKVPQDFVVDLNTISYWGYNFDRFRPLNYPQPVYFRMGHGNSAQYLGVRSYAEAMARSANPEVYKD